MIELAAEDASRREGLLSKMFGFLFLEVTSIPAMIATKFEQQKRPPFLGAALFFNEGYDCAL